MNIQKSNNGQWKNILHNMLDKLAYVMVVFYFVLSLLLMLTDVFSASLTSLQRYSVGGILLVYSIFRAYRIYLSQKETNENE
ncbi:MAG: hypothetical protein ACOYO1_13125 [Bacteroidales bacterium]